MKNGSLNYSYFGNGFIFMLYDETRYDSAGACRLLVDCRFMQIRTELLMYAGCLDSELL